MRKVSLMLMLAGLLMATSCDAMLNKAKENENQNEQEQLQEENVSQVEQVQPHVQRTAFLPTQNTPDFVDAAENSVDAVVHPPQS